MRLLTVLSLICFASAMSVRIMDPLVPAIARSFTIAIPTAALIAAASAFPYALSQPLVGTLGDAVGKVRVMRVCLYFQLAATLLAMLAPTFEALFAARAVTGFAGGGVIPLALALVGDRVGGGERQVALSRVLMAMQTATLLGLGGSGVVAELFGWRAVLGVVLAATAVAAVAASMTLSPEPAAERRSPSFKAGREIYLRLLSNPRARAAYLAVFLAGIVVFGLYAFVSARIEQRGLGGLVQGSLVLSCSAVGGISYGLSARWLLARFGQAGMMRLGGVLAGVGLLCAAYSPSWIAEAVAFMLVGGGYYMVHNSFQTIATEIAPDARGSAVALHAVAFFLGQALGPVVYRQAFALLGWELPVVIAAACVPALAIWSSYRATAPAAPKNRA